MKKELKKLNKTFAIFSIILLIISGILMSFSFTFAQTTLPGYTPMPDRPTWTEVGLSPNLVGLGQELTINIITYPGPSGPTYEAQYLVGELVGGFKDISITIRHPNGSEETYKPIDETLAQCGIEIPGQAQIVGHLQFRYKPTEVGTYTFTASFPGQFYTTDNIYEPGKLSVYYKPSSSTKPAVLTVQEDKVIESGLLTGWPWQPLPEGYWENPVQTNNREWYQVSGDWLQNGWDTAASKYNPFSTAPNTPHILWTREVWAGGLPGGIWGSLPGVSSTYSMSSPIMMNGKIYKNGRSGYFECIDLRTGELLWEAPCAKSIDIGQSLDPAYQTATQLAEGYIDQWIWAGTRESRNGGGSDKWYMYDPFDGDLVRTITNVPKDLTGIKFQDGSSDVYVVQANLNTWNTTKPMKLAYVNLIKWSLAKMVNTVVYSNIFSNNWLDGIVWNVSCQTGDIVEVGDNNFRGPEPFVYYGANVVAVRTPNAMQHAIGFDMTTGALLWKNSNMVHDIDVRYEGVATSPYGPLIKQNSGAPEWVAYDVKTGREIWRAPTGELPWGLLPSYEFIYHDGVHFMGSYDGHVYAYDTNTGQLVWKSDYVGEQWETIYGNQPITGYNVAGADGKLYFATSTIYRMMPRTRFHETLCIDEYTGEFIWRLPISIQAVGITDGYLLGYDEDNGIMYCVGKGKTETTVMASPKVTAEGTSVLIEGTVMDMSPGKPNVPAISDTDMSEWMDYLYGQNATLINNPPMPNGVQVTLTASDSSGNTFDIGTVTSDGTGLFKKLWTPETTGEYTIFASFAGSDSYWSSYGETALGVVEPTSPSGPIEPEPTPEHPIISTELAIAIGVIVVAVVAAVAYVVYKRRK